MDTCMQFSRELMPWLAPPGGDPAICSDASAASFLPAAYAALQDVYADGGRSRAVPQPQAIVDNAFNTSAVFDISPISVPEAAPVSAGEFDLEHALVRQAYPPRGTLPLLPPHLERCPSHISNMDCLLVQEYFLHILHSYAANGTALIEELTSGTPTPFNSIALLVELLMSQMLLPAPTLMVFGYQSLLVRLVEVIGQPLAMCAPPAVVGHVYTHAVVGNGRQW
jgi:hypothetical protein